MRFTVQFLRFGPGKKETTLEITGFSNNFVTLITSGVLIHLQ